MSIISSYSVNSSRWFSAIERRRSRRAFDPSKQIPAGIMSGMKLFCKEFRPFGDVRAELVPGTPSKLFKGAIGPYGKITGAPNFVAFIGDINAPNVQEHIGYVGEATILEATALGLNTCWVGGFFRREIAESLVDLSRNERVVAVTPIGYAKNAYSLGELTMTGFGYSHRRKDLSTLVTNLDGVKWPQWIMEALEAARLAPSAVNRQPWRFMVEPDAVTVSVGTQGPEFNISKRLDCGIAMLHIEVAATNHYYAGDWQFMEHPLVARFQTKLSSNNN